MVKKATVESLMKKARGLKAAMEEPEIRYAPKILSNGWLERIEEVDFLNHNDEIDIGLMREIKEKALRCSW